ncbi:hypothetical protein ACWOFR_03300 [Carnobacterium gallinarum]|uniref:hypothetical protein n=1 Tax=Carnobacterium gallinarum TaxID=2749 RepID=UPI00054FD0BC|nr:hypothetical protein [Carnobacterium gallinarum]
MEECSTSPDNRLIEREVNKDYGYWLPVIAGIATKEEIAVATANELATWNQVSIEKIKLMRGGL